MARTKAEAIRRLNLRKIALRTSARPQALRKYAQNARIPYPHTVPPRPPSPLSPPREVYPTIAQLYGKTRPRNKMNLADFVKKAKKTRKGRCMTKKKEWVPVKGYFKVKVKDHRRRVTKCVRRRHTGPIPQHWYKSSVKRRKGG